MHSKILHNEEKAYIESLLQTPNPNYGKTFEEVAQVPSSAMRSSLKKALLKQMSEQAMKQDNSAVNSFFNKRNSQQGTVQDVEKKNHFIQKVVQGQNSEMATRSPHLKASAGGGQGPKQMTPSNNAGQNQLQMMTMEVRSESVENQGNQAIDAQPMPIHTKGQALMNSLRNGAPDNSRKEQMSLTQKNPNQVKLTPLGTNSARKL